MIGDGLQNGGALLMRKGGKVVLHFVQIGPADRLTEVDVLEVLFLRIFLSFLLLL